MYSVYPTKPADIIDRMRAKPAKKDSSRILPFDILRGYFLSVILLNHLWYYPSGLDIFTGRSILYVSTAEGFFAVSGIVLGIIRGYKLRSEPMKRVSALLLKRAGILYITSLVLTLVYTVLAWWAFTGNPGLPSGLAPASTSFAELLWNTLTLRYTYGWADFLRYYALFIALTPLALWLLRKGLWPIVVLTSVGVWACYPLISTQSFAVLASWQLVFFGGLCVGYYWKHLSDAWMRLSATMRKRIIAGLATTFFVTLSLAALLVFGGSIGGNVGNAIESIHRIVEQGFEKDRLPLPRILLGAIWFWAAFWMAWKLQHFVQHRMNWLVELGQNSLYTYIISSLVVFGFHLLLPSPGAGNPLANLALSLLALGIVIAAVKTKFLMNIIPR